MESGEMGEPQTHVSVGLS